jgi:2-polyprenyl-3-methyl-5-hydroxy-6-metoxy-1,4-benzoquinol methylase
MIRSIRDCQQVMRTERTAEIESRCRLCGAAAASAEVIFVKDGFVIVRCASCDLVYLQDPPSPNDLKRIYSFAAGYHVAFQAIDSRESQVYIGQAEEHLEIVHRYTRGGRILDVGCSVGFFLATAQAHGWDAYGVEVSEDTAEIARQRGVKVLTGTLEDASFESGLFDVVTLWDVIEHVDDPVGTMMTVERVLKNDGLVVISTPNIDGIFPRLSYYVSKPTGRWPHPEPPYHLCQFSKRTMRKLAARTGFDVLRILDRRLPLVNAFGSFHFVFRSPKRLAYAALLSPVALAGPLLKAGDHMIVIAKKAARSV